MADEDSITCGHCGCSCPESDATDVIVSASEFVKPANEFKVIKKLTYCEHCRGNESFYCTMSDEYYADENFTCVEDNDGENVCLAYVIQLGWQNVTHGDSDYWCRAEDVPAMWTCVCCNDTYVEGDEDEFLAVTEIDAEGNSECTSSYCSVCHGENTFYCQVSCGHYDKDEFTCVNDEDGDDVCREYVLTQGWTSYVDDNGDEVWESPERALERAAEKVSTDKEGNGMAWVDFYWKLPDSKAKIATNEDPRVLVLMDDSGAEASSADNSGVKTFKQKVFAKIKDAGANAGDSDVLLVYTRLVLIEGGILNSSYRL